MPFTTYNETSANYSYRDYISSPLNCCIYSCSVAKEGLPVLKGRLNWTEIVHMLCGTRLVLNVSMYASWNTKDLAQSSIALSFFPSFWILYFNTFGKTLGQGEIATSQGSCEHRTTRRQAVPVVIFRLSVCCAHYMLDAKKFSCNTLRY